MFAPALDVAMQLFSTGSAGSGHLIPVLIFMSDGVNEDGDCSSIMRSMHEKYPDLQCHTIFFGSGGSQQLQNMASAVPNGKYHLSVSGVQLSQTFAAIALGAEFTGTHKG